VMAIVDAQHQARDEQMKLLMATMTTMQEEMVRTHPWALNTHPHTHTHTHTPLSVDPSGSNQSSKRASERYVHALCSALLCSAAALLCGCS
jgi:hypothetical protein